MNRTVRIHRQDAGSESVFRQLDRGMCTPEQALDDGRADGIPIRTFADVQREAAARLAEISRMVGDYKVSRAAGGCVVELIPVGRKRGQVYPSIKAAARAVGVNDSNISQQLKRHPTWAGYIWRFRGRMTA